MRVVQLTMLGLVLVTLPVYGQGPGQRRGELQQQVIQRFMQNVRVQAGLSDEQTERFQAVTRDMFEARARLQQREVQLWRALEGQMRPGVAANADSVGRVLEGLVVIQEERAGLMRQEQRQLAEFLNPVQRAQVSMALRRLEQQIERVRQGAGRPM